jgi:hypothetical protein
MIRSYDNRKLNDKKYKYYILKGVQCPPDIGIHQYCKESNQTVNESKKYILIFVNICI